MSYTSSYLRRKDSAADYERSLDRSLDGLEQALTPILDQFDAIAVSGLSGAIPGAIFAYRHNKKMLVVRKDDDVTHGMRVEGLDPYDKPKSVVVIDDFVSSGMTLTRILKHLRVYDVKPRWLVLYDGGTTFISHVPVDGVTIDIDHQESYLYNLVERSPSWESKSVVPTEIAQQKLADLGRAYGAAL